MEAVCARVAHGELVKYAAKAEGTSEQRIREWGITEPFAALYARARESQAHALADQAVAIADGTDALTALYDGLIAAEGAAVAKDGGPFADQRARQLMNQLRKNVIDRDKLRLDARKWLTSKIAPKLYGERLDVTSDGKALPATQTVIIGDRTIAF